MVKRSLPVGFRRKKTDAVALAGLAFKIHISTANSRFINFAYPALEPPIVGGAFGSCRSGRSDTTFASSL